MRILVLSDLHLEFGPFTPPVTDVDLVVLAGDIHVKGRGLAWAKEVFSCPVAYVLGNHDYYNGHLEWLPRALAEQAAGSNVHVLERGELRLGGVRVLGGTCWTDYQLNGQAPLAAFDAERTMSDFKKIRCGLDSRGNRVFHRLKAGVLIRENALFREWLSKKLAEPFEGKTVVVTHHAPSELSLHPMYRETEKQAYLNAAYASRLEYEMEGVDLWVHGHTHNSADYSVLGTRVVCNPRGYAGDGLNPEFDPALVLEL